MVVLLGVIVGLLIPPTGLRLCQVSHRGRASRSLTQLLTREDFGKTTIGQTRFFFLSFHLTADILPASRAAPQPRQRPRQIAGTRKNPSLFGTPN